MIFFNVFKVVIIKTKIPRFKPIILLGNARGVTSLCQIAGDVYKPAF